LDAWAHAFKFGGEFRDASSEAKTEHGNVLFQLRCCGLLPSVDLFLGTTTQGQTSATDIRDTSTRRILRCWVLLATNGNKRRALSNYLAGSLSNITNLYFTIGSERSVASGPTTATSIS
jgi:hypothetical protein